MDLILASSSPRRRGLLDGSGIPFRAVGVLVDETPPEGVPPEEVAELLAERKARAAAARFPDCRVLGADTIVVEGGAILGKPADADAARICLARLSGTTHEVFTGLCLIEPGTGLVERRTVRTRVRFRDLGNEEIEKYVESGEPFDKAGGYGIQGPAADFVEELDGPADNVIGLPVDVVREMLA